MGFNMNMRLKHDKDSLMDQYKQVSAINDKKLKAARNINELVQIRIEKIPQVSSFDLKFDPLTFRQQMPSMG